MGKVTQQKSVWHGDSGMGISGKYSFCAPAKELVLMGEENQHRPRGQKDLGLAFSPPRGRPAVTHTAKVAGLSQLASSVSPSGLGVVVKIK